MSERAAIGRWNNGDPHGVYVGSDGHPTRTGAQLWRDLHGPFGGDLQKLLRFYLDEAPSGWITIFNHNVLLPPRSLSLPKRFVDDGGITKEGQEWIDTPKPRKPHDPADGRGSLARVSGAWSLDWAYVINEEAGTLLAYDFRAEGNSWSAPIAEIDLFGEEPNWTGVECGTDFSRCSHMAWAHFEECKDGPSSRLTTKAYLGHRPLDRRDAVAYIKDGVRARATGNGGNSDYLNDWKKTGFPKDRWVESVEMPDGSRADWPVARIFENADPKPVRGVTWVFPPTKDHPHETTLSLEGGKPVWGGAPSP